MSSMGEFPDEAPTMDLRKIAFRVASPFETFGLVSAYRAGGDRFENEFRHESLKKELEGLGLRYGEYLGQWEGNREKSLAVKDISPETLEEFGRRYGQDAVVYVAPGVRKLIRLRA